MDSNVINYWTWKDSEIISALKEYGVDLGEEYNRKKGIALLKAAEEGTLVDPDAPKEDRATVYDNLKPDEIEGELMLTRVIFHNTSDQDLPYVFMGHNGKAFYVPREVEVDIPDYLLDSCIKDAVEERMIPQVLNDGDIKYVSRRVQRFPYTIVKKSFPASELKKGR